MKVSSILRSTINLAFVYHISMAEIQYSPLSSIDKLAKASISQKNIPPCSACKTLVESFLKALEETTRLNFEGGDADWERQKLGNYENSELRFIEIQEKLCSDLKSGTDQCYNLAETNEAELEHWFFKKRNEYDLFTYLCLDHLRVCCPNNTYGPNCVPCPGGLEKPCSGHGNCLNSGTREEPAECLCDEGYTGDLCDRCKIGYYRDLATNELTCNLCDTACRDHCRGPGPKHCEVCSKEYEFIPNEGCILKKDTLDGDKDDNSTVFESSNQTDSTNLQTKSEVLNYDNELSGHHEL